MNKQMLTYVAIALIVLMAADKLRSLPVINKLPTI